MTIARKLQDYIAGKGILYDTVAHHRTSTTGQTALYDGRTGEALTHTTGRING